MVLKDLVELTGWLYSRLVAVPIFYEIWIKIVIYSVALLFQVKNGELLRSRERLLRTQRHPTPSVICKFTRSQIMAVITLILAEFISFCSMSVMAPFFPKEVCTLVFREEEGTRVRYAG